MGRTAADHAFLSGSMWAVPITISQYVQHSVQSFQIVFVKNLFYHLTENLTVPIGVCYQINTFELITTIFLQLGPWSTSTDSDVESSHPGLLP